MTMRWSIYTLAFAFFAVFLLLPVGTAVLAGITDPATGQFTAAFLREALADPLHREGLLNALGIACVTTALTAGIALPVAWVMARTVFPGKPLAEVLLLAPLILPPFVGALGFEAVLGRHGALNALLVQAGLIGWDDPPDWLGSHRFAAICLIESLHLYPFLYLTAAASISRLDPALVEAARIGGAGPWTVFRRIWLPLLRPGLFAGGVVIFVWSFTELGTPLMLGYDRHVAVQIYAGLAEAEKNRLPFAQVIVMLAVAAAAYVVARTLFAKAERALAAKGAHSGSPRQLTGLAALGAWLLIGAVSALAAAPHAAVAVLAVAQDWYRSVLPSGLTVTHLRDALVHPQVVSSILQSLKYSALATTLALVLGTYVAWATVRWRPRGWQALDLLAMLPLAIPGIILAFGYRALPSIHGFGWLNPVVEPTMLIALAYGVRRLPYVVRAAAAGYEQTPVALEEAAAISGAGAFLRLRRIVLPLLAASLAAGAILAFSFSMLEVADSLILAERREHWPITKVMFGLTDILGNGPAIACAFATWAMLFLAAAFAAAQALSGRRLGSAMRV